MLTVDLLFAFTSFFDLFARLRQQKKNFCLPKVLFLFIQAAGLAYHRRAKCGAYHQGRQAALVSHQPLWGWISSRASVHLPAA